MRSPDNFGLFRVKTRSPLGLGHSVLYSFNYKHLPQICLSEIWTRFNKSCLGLDNMGWSKLSHFCLFARFQTPGRSLKWSFETQAYWVPTTGLVWAFGTHSTCLTQTLGMHSTCLTQAFRIEKMHLNSFLLFLKETWAQLALMGGRQWEDVMASLTRWSIMSEGLLQTTSQTIR